MAAHGSRSNANAVALLAEDQTRGTEAVIRAIKVDSTDAVPVLYLVIEPTSFGRDPGVRDHDVEAAEILDDLVHRLLDGFVLAHVNLVPLDLDAELLGNGSAQLLCLR